MSDNADSYIVDSLIIKGVSPNRDDNDTNFDYQLDKALDNQGMRFYMHKYFAGWMHFYQHVAYQKEIERLQILYPEIEKRKRA